MSESNVPPPPGPSDPYDTAPASAPPPPPDAAMLNPTPAPPPGTPAGQPVGYANPMTGGYPGPYNGPPPDPNAKTMGMLCHILSLAGLVIPLGNLIGPLIIWQVKKQEHPFIDDQGKESVNFQITYTILLVISIALICLVIGMFLTPVVAIVGVVFSIIGGVKANNGEPYRYPLTLRLIR